MYRMKIECDPYDIDRRPSREQPLEDSDTEETIGYDPYDIELQRPRQSPEDSNTEETKSDNPEELLELPGRGPIYDPCLVEHRRINCPPLEPFEPLTPLESLKDIRIEDFNFPERDSETTQPKKKKIIRRVLILLLFAAFFFNLGLNLSDTVNSQIKIGEITSLVKTLDLEESNLKSQLSELREFQNKFQHGPAFSYIDNRTKVLTIFCYPKETIRQFTLENNFNFSDCSLTK